MVRLLYCLFQSIVINFLITTTVFATDAGFSSTLLKGKVVIVTGGAKGIGEKVVARVVEVGGVPVIVDLDTKVGNDLSTKLQKANVKHLLFLGDLQDEFFCKSIITKTLTKFGHIDVLVNNAGVNDGVGLSNNTDEFNKSLHRNLIHYFTMTHYAIGALKKSKGSIVNISSKVALVGQGNTSGYAAAKGGILSLTREWALELANSGVRVNAIIPAEVDTPQYQKWLSKVDNPQQKLELIKRRIPLERRMTTADEIANAVIFLASKLASHTTGELLHIDGGYTNLDKLS